MVSKEDSRIVLYPIYFDRNAPRPPRRVRKDLAVSSPTSEEIAQAASRLGLRPVLERGSAHPRAPWDRSGRVLVEIRGIKSVLLAQIAREIQRGRSGPIPH